MVDNINLGAIFQTVTEQLSQKKETLNEADTYNHDHGDHMVQIFNLVQNAVTKKSKEPVSKQLDYASKVVGKEAQSGSAKLYAEGLANAAKNFSGSELDQNTLGMLVKSLLNVEEQPQPEQPKQNTGLLSSLLSGLTGSSDSNKSDSSIGIDEILRAGMAFYQSKQNGESNTDAIVGALMAASPLGQSAHRSQSGGIVASTILNFASSLNK